jgi:hypothetical protein
MKFLIFFKKFYKVHSVEVSSQDTSRKVVLEHQATIAKLGAHMGLGHQVGAQGPCGHQVLQL